MDKLIVHANGVLAGLIFGHGAMADIDCRLDNINTVFGLCVDFHYESDRHATLNKAPNFFTT